VRGFGRTRGDLSVACSRAPISVCPFSETPKSEIPKRFCVLRQFSSCPCSIRSGDIHARAFSTVSSFSHFKNAEPALTYCQWHSHIINNSSTAHNVNAGNLAANSGNHISLISALSSFSLQYYVNVSRG